MQNISINREIISRQMKLRQRTIIFFHSITPLRCHTQKKDDSEKQQFSKKNTRKKLSTMKAKALFFSLSTHAFLAVSCFFVSLNSYNSKIRTLLHCIENFPSTTNSTRKLVPL